MVLSEYINNLQQILEEHGDLEVVYSSDDEGNDFNRVYHTPNIGHYSNREFIGINNEDDFNHDVNAVCIN